MPKIEIRNLFKVFGPHPSRALQLLEQGVGKDEIFNRTGHAIGLADVSFDVEEGEILVVMGLSGSGKSTLIRCVNRLIEPTAGGIRVDDRDVMALDHEALRRFRQEKLAMVFQHFALLPHRSVLANVEFGLEIQSRTPEERRRRAEEALALVGLEGWGDSYPAQLSGGMQQRVGLARALAVDPEVMLMDEAFSALDPLIRRDMQHELVSLQERMHKTILFVSHDLDEAIKIGDRIVLMKDGAIVQIGTPEEILTSPATPYVARFVEDVDIAKVLTAGSVMSKVRVVGYPSDGPRTALHKMRDENASALFVVTRDYVLQGVVSTEDAERALREGRRELRALVRGDVEAVGPDTPVPELFGRLSAQDHALPVVDEGGRLLGAVFRAGLLEALAAETPAPPATTAEEPRQESAHG